METIVDKTTSALYNIIYCKYVTAFRQLIYELAVTGGEIVYVSVSAV